MKILSITLLAFILCDFATAQNLPEGYILQYKQDFSNGKSLSDFTFSHTAHWGIFRANSNYYLQCTGFPDSLTQSYLPSSMAVLSNRIFGDFILETNVMPMVDTNGLGEICLYLGMKDHSQYYFVQLANKCDSAHHGVFLVKNSPPQKLPGSNTEGIIWKENKWHKIRLERNIVRRTITVFLDDMTTPVFHVKDYELVMGMVGIGSFRSPCRFDNLSIWSQTVIVNE